MGNTINISIRIHNDEYLESEGKMLLENHDYWRSACGELSYDAFKLYLEYLTLTACEFDSKVNTDKHEEVYLCTINGHEDCIEDIKKAFDELVDKGYIHHYGVYQDDDGCLTIKHLWDFFLYPISASEYASYIHALNIIR